MPKPTSMLAVMVVRMDLGAVFLTARATGALRTAGADFLAGAGVLEVFLDDFFMTVYGAFLA